MTNTYGGAVSGSSSSNPPVDDPTDPFYLHHSDNPGLVLVHQVLTGDNYASWNRAMSIALSVKNKIGFVDGTITKPSAQDQKSLLGWQRNNDIVIAWILNSVSKEISASVLYSRTAREIWLDLEERFQQSNGPRIFQLRQEISGTSSISLYFTKLKALWEEYENFKPSCSCGKCNCKGTKDLRSFLDRDYVMTFLMGLHDSYSQVRGQILLMDPLPTINKVFSLVSQEERQRSVTSISSNSQESIQHMAFQMKATNQPAGSNQDNRKGSIAGFKKDPNKPHCTHCNRQGHTQETCYKLHGWLQTERKE